MRHCIRSLAFVLLIAVTLLILVMVEVKSDNGYIDPEFEIHSISLLSPFDNDTGIRDTSYTTYLNISFASINPNRYEVSFDNIVFSVFLEEQLFLVGVLPPFRHKPGERKLVEQFIVPSVGFGENISSAVGGGKFGVRIDARMDYAPGTFFEIIDANPVWCEDVRVEFPPLP